MQAVARASDVSSSAAPPVLRHKPNGCNRDAPGFPAKTLLQKKHSGKLLRSVRGNNSFQRFSDYHCGRRGHRDDPGHASGHCRDLHGPSGLRAVASPVDSDRSVDGSNMHLRKGVAASGPGPICSGGRSVPNTPRPSCSRALVRLLDAHIAEVGERFRCTERPGQTTGPQSRSSTTGRITIFNFIVYLLSIQL